MPRLSVYGTALLGCLAAAQAPPADAPASAITAAIDAWLASDQVDEARLQATVERVLAAPAGLALLGDRLRPAGEPPADRDRKGLTALATHVVLGFLQRARQSGMTFKDQYAPLLVLQPFAGELLQQLLLATPEWFPDTSRRDLVLPLRDLYAGPPSPAAVLGVIDMVRNVDIEPADLRRDLACLLWQWGRREFVTPILDRLRAASAEGDADDRLVALRDLANLQYQLRDYARAAATHTSLTTLADHAELPLSPTDWYWAACCKSLAGDREGGFAALQRCIALQRDADLDASLKLPRSLFARDPELALLRQDPRFQPLIAAAFPPAHPDDKDR